MQQTTGSMQAETKIECERESENLLYLCQLLASIPSHHCQLLSNLHPNKQNNKELKKTARAKRKKLESGDNQLRMNESTNSSIDN
jgi:hypothetical protein